MNSRDYWKKRIEQVAATQHLRADEVIAKLEKDYKQAINSIQKDIEVFYLRYAENNGISLAAARKQLSPKELNSFKMDVEEFIRLAKNNPDGEWTQLLNNVSFRVRVTRLEALRLQIENSLQVLSTKQEKELTQLLGDTYEDSYYRTLYELQKGTQIGVTFSKLDTVTMDQMIRTQWLGENYSKRIWANNKELARLIEVELKQTIIRGDDANKAIDLISSRMNTSHKNAQRLFRTEASHIQNEATFNSYKASKVVDKYEYLATLDGRTSEICQEMDDHVFTFTEKETGVNFPPLHPNCRSTTTPYFDDEINPGQRAARINGEVKFVPGNISYKEWFSTYVGGE